MFKGLAELPGSLSPGESPKSRCLKKATGKRGAERPHRAPGGRVLVGGGWWGLMPGAGGEG